VQAAINQGAYVNDKDESGWTPLMYAAGHNKNPEVITVLLKAGADLNAQEDHRGKTPLIVAAWRNYNPEVIVTLLKAGANVKAQDHFGATALDYAQDNDKLKGTDALRQLQKASQ
jgi:ankyrin repeat protein